MHELTHIPDPGNCCGPSSAPSCGGPETTPESSPSRSSVKALLSIAVLAAAVGVAGWSVGQRNANASASAAGPKVLHVEDTPDAAAEGVGSLAASHDVVFVVIPDPEHPTPQLESTVAALVDKIGARGKTATSITLDPGDPSHRPWLQDNDVTSFPSVVLTGAGCGGSVTITGDLSTAALADAYAGVSSQANTPCNTPCDTPCDKSKGA